MRVPGPSRAGLDRAGDAFADLVARDLRAALGAAARDLPRVAPTPDDLGALRRSWGDRVERRLLPELRRAWAGAAGAQRDRLLRAAERADALVAAPVEIPPVRQELAEAYLAEAANRLSGVGDHAWELARERLVEGTRLGEGVGPLRDRLTSTLDVARPRAEVVARTEVVGASNRGALEQMYAAGLPATKEWVATGDARTRATHRAVDGKRVDLKESFTVGGHPMDGPHDPRGPASETISCRCTLVFDIPDDELVETETEDFHLPGRHSQGTHGTGGGKSPLSGAQQDAMMPGGTAAATRRALSETPEGQQVLGAVTQFTETRGGVTNMRKNVEKRASGEKLSKPNEERVDALVGAMNTFPPDRVPQLYRGMGIKPRPEPGEHVNRWFDRFEASYAPGTKLDMNVTSFTSSDKKSEEFMRSPGGTKTGQRGLVHVKVVVDGRIHALPVENLSKFKREREWISGGRFEVTRLEPPAGKRTHYVIGVRQVDTLSTGRSE